MHPRRGRGLPGPHGRNADPSVRTRERDRRGGDRGHHRRSHEDGEEGFRRQRSRARPRRTLAPPDPTQGGDGRPGRFLVARVAGEPASVVAFYEGEDRYVHHLATRVPFRRRGLASRLLEDVLAGALERPCRSTIISAAENGRPADLYRSLGFTDEVYWRREYKHVPTTACAVDNGTIRSS